MLMKYSPDWKTFMDRRDREYPQCGTNYLLPWPDDYTAPEIAPSSDLSTAFPLPAEQLQLAAPAE
jgi:hypothetical protein